MTDETNNLLPKSKLNVRFVIDVDDNALNVYVKEPESIGSDVVVVKQPMSHAVGGNNCGP